MAEPKVWTFFYGSFINLDVLKQVNLLPEQVEVAKLNGFDIRIRPLANLVRSDQHCVYGIVATATHDELNRLYAYAQTGLGGTPRKLPTIGSRVCDEAPLGDIGLAAEELNYA